MKNNFLKLNIAGALLGIGAVIMPIGSVHAAVSDECSKDLLLAYFPEIFVNETLKKYNIPQDQWASINKELAARDQDVVKIVEEKAAKLTPNPLKDPQQRQTAVKIFRETLLQVFTDVISQHGVKDEKQIHAMLDDIQQQKAKRFAQCMEKQKTTVPAQPAAPSESTHPKTTPQPHQQPTSDRYKRSAYENAQANADDNTKPDSSDNTSDDLDDDDDN